MSKSQENLKNILRKSRGSISKIKCFHWPKVDVVIVAFKISKMELKYSGLAKKV